MLAEAARVQLGLERVLFVPAGTPPHKPEGPSMEAELRAHLLSAALAGHEGFELCSLELNRDGPSYTADTLEAIAAGEGGGADLWFLLGADQLAALPGWRAPERVLAAACLGVAPRLGAVGVDPPAPLEIPSERLRWLELSHIAISSRDIRRRLAEGRSVRWHVPPAVEEGLRRAGLVPS